MNNPRTVPYFVNRKVTPVGSEYHVHSPGKPCAIIRRKGKHFFTWATTTARCGTLSSTSFTESDMKPAELTPEIVRKLCRGLGGTKDLAGGLEEACQRVLNGGTYGEVLGDMWAEEEASKASVVCKTLGPTCQGCPDCSAVMGDATYNEMFGGKDD